MSFNLADLFERVAATVPDREAVVCGHRRLSYAELDQRADRVASALAAAGVGRGDHVAIALRNGIEYLELMLGAFKLAAVPVNVNYRYQLAELHHVLADCGARVVVHEPGTAALIDVVRRRLPEIEHAIERGTAYETWLDDAAGPVPAVDRGDDDLYVLYTGGTTGDPKGVVWRHVDIFFAAMGGGIRGGDAISHPDEIVDQVAEVPSRVLAASPLMHGTAHWFAFLTLFGGGTVVLSADTTLSPDRVLDLLHAEKISTLVLVGDAIAAPLASALDTEPRRWELDALTVILSGGATLSAPVRRSLLGHLPWIVVVDSYGTSETGGQASAVHTPGMDVRSVAQTFEPRTHTLVVDADMQPVAPGTEIVGRIARRGHVPLCYHGDPESTAATFPVIDGERWAITGDHAMVAADGRIVLLGRGSTTINSGGEKIHPEEVEAVLREHPAIYDAVVVGVPDERWGERVTAVVAARPGRVVVAEELTEHCRTRLAAFKAPRSVVVVDEVQRLESGKPDHRWAHAAAAGAPLHSG
ncbi:MAG: AMP-binding protein [Acidimicrobiia bacterium]|nr:AMP-binding protein [Acidimicrobiia bacterium]